MKYLTVGVILCVFLELVKSDDPPCPQLDCPRVSTVGCFINDQRCQCFCVEREDACEYIVHNYEKTCRADQIMHCISDANECKCRCEQM
ncbi:hypothetical protein MTO96_050712 [Rhipicephalus appendiculatus]